MTAPALAQLKLTIQQLGLLLDQEVPDHLGARATPNQCQRRLNKLVGMKKELRTTVCKFEELQREISDNIGKANRDNAAQREQSYTELLVTLDMTTKATRYQQKIFEIDGQIENLEERLDLTSGGSTPTVHVRAHPTPPRKNLPTTELKKFDGSAEDWLPFWDHFSALIHNDNAIPKVEKFIHLDASLESKASEIIAGIPITDAGYDTAIDLLLKEYGDAKKLIRKLNNELLRIPPSANFEEDEKMYLRIEKIFRQLESQNQNVEDSLYYTSIEGKISPQVLDKYYTIKDAEDNDDWDTTKFRDAFSRALGQIKNRQEARKSALGKEDEGSSQTMNFAVTDRGRKEKDFRVDKRSPNFGRKERNSRSPNFERKFRGSKFKDRSRSNSESDYRRKKFSDRKRGSPFPQRRERSSSYDSRTSSSRSRTPEKRCQLCKRNHNVEKCDKYTDLQRRKNKAFELELCLICLKPNHWASSCWQKHIRCKNCESKGHHPSLCNKRYGYRTKSSSSSERSKSPRKQRTTATQDCSESSEVKSDIVATSCIANPKRKFSLLKCKYVTIYNPLRPELRKRVLAFMDDGSQRSYILSSLAKELKLEVLDEQTLSFSGLQGIGLGQYKSSLHELGIKGKHLNMLMHCGSLKKILKKLPVIQVSKLAREQLEKTKLRVPEKWEEPQIMIGNDYYNRLEVSVGERLQSGFNINESRVGRFLSGAGKVEFLKKENNEWKLENEHISASTFESQNNGKQDKIEWIITSSLAQNPKEEKDREIDMEFEDEEMSKKEFSKLIKRMDGLNNIGLSDLTSKEQEMRERMIDKISFNGERYQTELLWNEEMAARLPTNYDMAYKQLMSNLERLQKTPKMLEIIHNTIMDQVKAKFVEECEPIVDRYLVGQKVHYLPHHPVIKETSEHTKVRIVYNASARRGNFPSLNEVIEKGPNEYNDLTGIMLRARLKPILIASDIAKAFHQIEIHPKDRNVMRFLWVKNPFDKKIKVKEYRFTRVTFGVICSPAHLALTINTHLKNYDDPLIRQIENDIYVDNILVGARTADEIPKIYKKLKKVFEEAGMNVREFMSNCREEILKLPPEDRIDKNEAKLLGIKWNLENDILKIAFPNFNSEKLTRRKVLSQIAKTFDPAGMVSPAILSAKLFRQEVETNKKLKWDTSLSQKEMKKWNEVMEKWKDMTIEFPRKVIPEDLSRDTKFELHAFTDASSKAFGAAIYLRVESKNEIKCNLIFGKSLVVPSTMVGKRRTIPMLELHAAVMLGKFTDFVQNELEKTIKISKVQLWTDSTDVVDFLNSKKKLDKYVRNRVEKIRKWNFRHIDGKNNPSDAASRGLTPKELKEFKSWWHGPEFLSKKVKDWPKSIKEFNPNEWEKQIPENIQICEMSNACEEKIKKGNRETQACALDFTRCSNWRRLKNTIAYVRRWRQKASEQDVGIREASLKEKIQEIRPLSVEEINESEKTIIKVMQKAYPPSKDTEKNLYIFKDETGILRSRGRIEEGGMDYDTVNPIYLSNKVPILPLLIRYAHLETEHGRRGQILGFLRRKFWIPRCKREITYIIRKNPKTKCGICAKFEAKAYNYPDAPKLPIYRVKGNSAFEAVGIDNFGPMHVKIGGKTQKVWGTIFACTLTRAIHLELVTDCSAEKFLLALERFIRRRRVPKKILSDNGSNFVLAQKVVSKICEEEQKTKATWEKIHKHEKIQEFAVEKGISWEFNSPLAPWRSGFYERLIGLIKHHLYRGLGKKILDYEELMTYLVQVERILNERPLTQLEEGDNIEPICPINILNASDGNPFEFGLEPSQEDIDDPDYLPTKTKRDELLETHKKTMYRSTLFWQSFEENYLLALRENYKKNKREGTKFPKIGQIVIIRDTHPSPKNKWKLGKVLEVMNNRTAKVLVPPQKTIERATSLLYPLEIELEEQETEYGRQ